MQTNSKQTSPMQKIKYKRILVKLSGEALRGDQASGIDPQMIDKLCTELLQLRDAGVEVACVVGGGNLMRGASLASGGLDRVTADHMGMLATVMNALALKDGLQRQGAMALVMSGLAMPQVCETYTQRHARQHLAAGDIVIFAAGHRRSVRRGRRVSLLRSAQRRSAHGSRDGPTRQSSQRTDRLPSSGRTCRYSL